MMTSKRFLFLTIGAALLACFFTGAPAFAADITEEARRFIEVRGNQSIQVFGIKDRQTRYNKFRELLTDSFAINGIAKFVIGRFWNTAPADQQERYLKLFEEYIIANYAAKSWVVDNVNLRVVNVVRNDADDVSVDTLIHIPHKENKDVPLGFRVRQGNGGMKIVDLKVDGVSLIISHRSEFTSVMGTYGGDLNKFNEFLLDRTRKLEKTAQIVEAMPARQ